MRKERLGPQDLATLVTGGSYACFLNEIGRHQQSEAIYAQTLPLLMRTVGADHPEVMRTEHNIAFALEMQGKLSAAEARFRAVVEKRRRVLGPCDPETVVSEAMLAMCLRGQGRSPEALVLCQETLGRLIEAEGTESEAAMQARYRLACVLADLERNIEAFNEMRITSTIASKLLPSGHEFRAKVAAAAADLSGRSNR